MNGISNVPSDISSMSLEAKTSPELREKYTPCHRCLPFFPRHLIDIFQTITQILADPFQWCFVRMYQMVSISVMVFFWGQCVNNCLEYRKAIESI